MSVDLRKAAAAAHLHAALPHLLQARELLGMAASGAGTRQAGAARDVAWACRVADRASSALQPVQAMAIRNLEEAPAPAGPAGDGASLDAIRAAEDALFAHLVVEMARRHGWGVHTNQSVAEWLDGRLAS